MYEWVRLLSELAGIDLSSTCQLCLRPFHRISHPLEDPMELRVGPPEAQHSVGAIVWGKGASADTLFASSESQSITDHSGYHVAFDPDQGRRTYEFSAKESGDAMALDPDGSAIRVQSKFRNKLTIFSRRCTAGPMHRLS
jgi:hypothetical protein